MSFTAIRNHVLFISRGLNWFKNIAREGSYVYLSTKHLMLMALCNLFH